MSTTSVRRAAFGALTSLLVGPARAQIDPMILSDATIQAGQTATLVAALNAQAKQDSVSLRGKGRLPVVSSSAAGTKFEANLARRQAQATKFLAAAKRLNPEIGKTLAPLFQTDPVRYTTPYLAKYGVRTDDVADLTAVYLVSSWYGANGKTSDPTRAHIAAVRDQLRRTYRGSSKLRGASNATKQNLGEGCLYLALLNDVFIKAMKAHPESKTRLMAEIAAGAKATFGLDLRTMRITSAGLSG